MFVPKVGPSLKGGIVINVIECELQSYGPPITYGRKSLRAYVPPYS